MPTAIYEGGNIFAPAFAFDADLQWGETLGYQVTKRKVEGKGEISDYIASDPEIARVTGKVTAMTVEPALPESEKLVSAKERLKQLAQKKSIVLVLSELTAQYLAINRVEFSKGVADGYSFQATIGFIEIETTTVATTQIPASRLRAKVKRRAATGKKGGAAKGSTPTGKSKTLALQLVQKFGFLGG